MNVKSAGLESYAVHSIIYTSLKTLLKKRTNKNSHGRIVFMNWHNCKIKFHQEDLTMTVLVRPNCQLDMA